MAKGSSRDPAGEVVMEAGEQALTRADPGSAETVTVVNGRHAFGLEGNLPDLFARYHGYLEYLRKAFELSPAEALARLEEEQRSEWLLSRARQCDPRDLGWVELETLCDHDPAEGERRWEEVKAAALVDLRRGRTAAKALEDSGGSLWARAEFLALREELAAGWKPQNGIEWNLIETMAQAHRMYSHWLTSARHWQEWEGRDVNAGKDPGSGPRLTNAQAADRSMEMADRWNRIFLRNLRALRDLRRYGPVFIQNQPGAQVNVAGQQIVATLPAGREERAERD